MQRLPSAWTSAQNLQTGMDLRRLFRPRRAPRDEPPTKDQRVSSGEAADSSRRRSGGGSETLGARNAIGFRAKRKRKCISLE